MSLKPVAGKTSGPIFIGLNAVRALSIIALTLVLAATVVTIVG